MIDTGPDTHIDSSAYVHESAYVGRDCFIGPGVFIGEGVRIGDRCIIKAGAAIGGTGFGYEWDDRLRRWLLKPHSHTVEIFPDVHIGSNTCIDRGSWRTTSIGQGCRIDNLVHIAHNVILRTNVVVIAHAEISGSVTVGEQAWIGPRACIHQRLSIGTCALVGMGAVVLDHVPPRVTVAGSPARVIDDKRGVEKVINGG